MGRSAGTGSPVYFACLKWRQGYWRNRRYPHDHVVKRTGRTKPYKTHKPGIRSLKVSHEYECSCGHVGWTNHMDIVRYPLRETTPTE